VRRSRRPGRRRARMGGCSLPCSTAIQRPRIAQTVSSRFRDRNVTVASRLHLCQRIHSQHARRRDARRPYALHRVHTRCYRERAPWDACMPSRVPPRMPQRHAGTHRDERSRRCCSNTCSTRRG
jgi:hypothetical protein